MKIYAPWLVLVSMLSGFSAQAEGHSCKGNDSLPPNPGTYHEFANVKMEANRIEFSLDGIPFYGVMDSPGLIRGKAPISYLVTYCVSAQLISSCETQTSRSSIDSMTFSFTGAWNNERLFSIRSNNFLVLCEAQ